MTEAVPADAGVPPTEEVAKTEEEEAKPLLTIYCAWWSGCGSCEHSADAVLR